MKSHIFRFFFLFSLLISLFTNAAVIVTPAHAVGEPTVSSIVRASADPTSASSVDFIVTFSEDVVDVDMGDFAITAAGITGESVTGLSGSGSSYTVTVDTGSGDGTLRLDVPDTASITDTELNPLFGLPFSSGESYTVDKSAPSVSSIVRASANPTSASSVDFTVTFSEAVTGVDMSDFSITAAGITGESITGLSGSGSSYTVTVDTGSGDGTLRLDVPGTASITDTALNALSGLPNTSGESYTVDKSAPSVSSITRASANPTIASSVDFTVTFSEAVIGVAVSDFSINATGITGESVTGVSGSGSSYTVTVGTGSGDGTLRLDVPGTASITDTALNALSVLPYTSGESYTVDKSVPSVSSITRASANPTSASSVDFTVTFSEAVTGVAMSDFSITATGITGASVTGLSGSGSSYTVTVDTGSGDGTLRLDVPDTASITDTTLNTLSGLPFTSGESYMVDKSAPTVTNVSSNTANGFFKQGASISTKVQFSEAVIVNTSGGAPTLCFETGATDRCVTYASGSGTDTITFNDYVVQAGDNSPDLEYVNTTALSLNGGTIQDAAGNNATLTLPATGGVGSLSYNKNFVVDTTPSAITSVFSDTADGLFKQGDAITVKVQFSEVVNVTGGAPTLCFETGAIDRCVSYVSGSGTNTLTFNDYAVQAGDNSPDLEYVDTSAFHLNSVAIKDSAGNDANPTLPNPGASGSFSYNNTFVVDTTSPVVVHVLSNTPDGTFKQGDHITVRVQFSENVNVTGGTPTLCFETGAIDRCVSYVSGSGTNTLTFNDYVVQAGDNSPDLEYVDTSAFHLNSVAIKDSAGNNANPTLPTPGAFGSFSYNNNFLVDTVSPFITQVLSSTPDGTFKQGDSITVQVLFSRPVYVNGGTPTLCFETGVIDRCVNYASGSGTSTLIFDNYIVQAGDNSTDLEYVNDSALHLNGATIQSGTGNDALLTLPTPGGPGSFSYNNTFVIDTILPTVTSIILSNGSPTTALSVEFFLTFSEPVIGVGIDDFSLATSGLPGASVTAVNGDYAWYDITASTGTGNGSLRLDIPNAATITDFAGNPLSGLPFTSGQTYSVIRNQTFQDVSTTHWAWEYAERLYISGITGGCSTAPLSFCPDNAVTRAQMAVFLLKGMHGSSFAPPAVGGSTGFNDVDAAYWAAAWIKQLAAEGITGGCGNGNFCPDNNVTRAQMAVFLLKSMHGSSYVPPEVGAGTGFTDVPSNYWAAAWVKQLAAEGITSGCGNGNYCPENSVIRAEMAVFLIKAFNLP